MHKGLPCMAAAALLLTASAAARTDTSFKLSPEAWARRCPAIENYETLDARGIYMDVVKARAVYARYDNDPDGGTVVLDIRVDTTGRVRDLALVSSTSGALTQPVMRAVSEWRYKPVVVDGKEVCVERRLEVGVSPNPYRRTSPDWGARGTITSSDHGTPPPGGPH